ncbi:MAG: efflux RND transporter periplasmic adaptor subunit [Flavobacteriales bacterium]|jgi:cobalt-zinc-cadmium efflux system membrane fusion protein|nr:efflux RND transporter periplasmic adaptor subunit [Flavobacteriales bacterium]
MLFAVLITSPSYASDDHGHADEHEEAGDRTTIDSESAQAMKIGTDIVRPGKVHQTISLTGKITLNKNRVAQVRARFPGLVRDVRSNIGDVVKKEQTLAIVESNQSLQAYPVTSPMDGVILGRNTNVGDTAENEPMFVVADLKKLWAEFFIFSRDLNSIKQGQAIRIRSLTDDTEAEAQLTTLLPTTESSSQTVVARVELNNDEDKWRAGMTVRGDVVLSEREVPLAVRTTAVQRQEGGQVVYVQEGNDYEMRKVEVGQSDREWTEILNGVQAGEIYVSENSFIVKADIAKSEAEHEH